MKTNKKFAVSALGLLFMTHSAISQEVIPHIFTPSTPAKASEVNENFDVLNQRLTSLEQHSLGLKLKDGYETIELDCTANPAALNETYLANWQQKQLIFEIAGSCYGDIAQPRTEDDPEVQVRGQDVIIIGKDETAKIIDNDISGKVGLLGGFGGGLYLSDLTIETESDFPVLYSRNGQGSLTNITIKKINGTPYSGLWVQEGAQVYVSDLSIEGFNTGIYATNGALVRIVGDVAITDVENGISLQNAFVRAQGDFNINASQSAVSMDIASGWIGWDTSITAESGRIDISRGSSMVAGLIDIPSSSVNLYSSTFEAYSLNASTFLSVSSDSTLSNANVSVFMDLQSGSNMNMSNSVTSNIMVQHASTLGAWGSTINELEANKGAFVEFGNVTVQGNVRMYENASSYINETIFEEGSFLNITANAQVNIFGNSTISEGQISCFGGYVNIENVDVSDFNNGCLDALGVQEMINAFKQSRAN